jgi:hypothetical protein
MASTRHSSDFDSARYRLVQVLHMQRDGKADVHLSNNILGSGVSSTVTPAHCSYCAQNEEMLF